MTTPPSNNLAELRAKLHRLRTERSVEELDESAATLLSHRFLSEVEYLTEAQGLTRRALAQAVGTTPSYITQLFRGDRLLNLTMVARFERVLGVRFHIRAVAPARPAPAPESHPAMLRKLPSALSGARFAQGQALAGGQAHAYSLSDEAFSLTAILA